MVIPLEDDAPPPISSRRLAPPPTPSAPPLPGGCRIAATSTGIVVCLVGSVTVHAIAFSRPDVRIAAATLAAAVLVGFVLLLAVGRRASLALVMVTVAALAGEIGLGVFRTSPRTGEVLLRGHGDLIAAACFSDDGSRIASGSFDGTIRVWDPASGDPVGVIRPTGRASDLAWSFPGGATLDLAPDRSLVIAPTVRGIAIHRVDDATRVAILPATGRHHAAFDDAARVVVAGPRATAVFEAPWTGAPIETPLDDVALAMLGPDPELRLDGRDGLVLRHSRQTGEILVHRVADGALAADTSVPGDTVDATLVAGGRFAAISRESELILLPIDGEELERRVRVSEGSNHVVSPDGALVASARGGRLLLHETDSGAPRADLPFGAGCRPLAFSPDGGRLAVASGRTISVVPVATLALGGTPLPRLPLFWLQSAIVAAFVVLSIRSVLESLARAATEGSDNDDAGVAPA